VALHPDGGVSPCWSNWFAAKDYGNWLRDDLAHLWRGETFQRARSTARHGGDAEGELVCDRCSHFKSFVPVPDRDDEPLPDLEQVDRVASLLAIAGASPAREVVQALRGELAPGSGDAELSTAPR
jgi:hypothetical protein